MGKLYYYNDEIIDLDDPGEIEDNLIRGDDLLIHNGIYYLRFDEMIDIIEYMIQAGGFVKVPEGEEMI